MSQSNLKSKALEEMFRRLYASNELLNAFTESDSTEMDSGEEKAMNTINQRKVRRTRRKPKVTFKENRSRSNKRQRRKRRAPTPSPNARSRSPQFVKRTSKKKNK